MEIKLIKKRNRNQLICKQKDGGFERIDLGPDLPAHDLAHYVVEQELSLKHGFYGNIYHGYTIEQLSDKEIIKMLDIETAVSEITTRALQSLHTGACTIDQFSDLIQEEFDNFSIVYPLNFTEERIWKMLLAFEDMLVQSKRLREGESITLQLSLNETLA